MDSGPGPSFPPLFRGLEVSGDIDPFSKACAMASLGCDAGTIAYNIRADRLAAAVVFAPEVDLESAMAMLPACGVGFQNALGALAPPEVSVHLDWSGGIYVNGAACGRLDAAASTGEPGEIPDWLSVGFSVPLIPEDKEAPGASPGQTSLFEEGCVEVSPAGLLESWSKHTLVWINRWTDDGPEALHREWRGLARGLGEDVEIDWQGGRACGVFVGIDEKFGMLLRTGKATRLIPLSSLLA